jgi:hypothetical protein
VEGRELGHITGLVLNTGHEFSDSNKINDERGGEQRILANVVDRDALTATHEDIALILIQGTLGVTDARHVLDDHGMVGMLTFSIQDLVGSHHVINNSGFGDFLGAELLVGRQVLAIIVTQVVVRGDTNRLDTSIDQKVNNSRLELGLTRLEIVTTNVGALTFSEFHHTGNKGVLRRTIDESNMFLDTRKSKHRGRRNFIVGSLDSSQDVISRVIDAFNDLW